MTTKHDPLGLSLAQGTQPNSQAPHSGNPYASSSQQPTQAGAQGPYKVVLVPAGCCEQALDVRRIEKNANKMAQYGYELVQAYQTSTTTCTGPKTACVLIFRYRG